MSKKTVYSEGSRSLAEFQAIVRQQEGIFGPLKSIGLNGDKNSITFDVSQSPSNRAILEVYEADEPPVKAGHEVVCFGNCLILGQPSKVAAYRVS
ncbi:TPA: hypothetical protein ACSP3N_003839 [Aeromonas veronii]